MQQLVGSHCTICGERVVSVETARLCPDCGRPVHNLCAGPTTDEGTCRGCGASCLGDDSAGFGTAVDGKASHLVTRWLSFRGRASRSEYFTHTILSGAAFVASMMLIGAADALGNAGPVVALTGLLLMLIVGGWSEMAVTVRRLHDLDLPGWHWLLSAVPIYNMYLGAVLLLKQGTIGENRFGPDPLLAGSSAGDALLLLASRHEMNRDWQAAFDAYKQASQKLQGHPNGAYAIECIKRLHEKVSQQSGRM